MANKVCMSVEKVINWKWKWANHSYKIFLIKNNTKLYSKINERCGFFFFFDELFFSSNGFGITWRQKGFHVMVLFSSSIIFFLEVKMMSNCTNTKKISVANFKFFMSKWVFFLLSPFFFPILSFNFRLPNFKMKYHLQVGNTVKEDPTKALGVWRRLWWWWKYDVRRILIREETTTTTNFREIR